MSSVSSRTFSKHLPTSIAAVLVRLEGEKGEEGPHRVFMGFQVPHLGQGMRPLTSGSSRVLQYRFVRFTSGVMLSLTRLFQLYRSFGFSCADASWKLRLMTSPLSHNLSAHNRSIQRITNRFAAVSHAVSSQSVRRILRPRRPHSRAWSCECPRGHWRGRRGSGGRRSRSTCHLQ